MPDLIEARWLPGYSVLTPTGEVHPGDVALIPEGEARESENWEPVTAPKPPKPDPKGDA